jgi:syntaxin 5
MGDGTAFRHDKKGKGRAHHNGDLLAMDLVSAEEGATHHNGGAFMQMQIMEQQASSLSPLVYILLTCFTSG